MVSMGIVQARQMVGEIRKAAQDFIACATEYNDDPSLVAEYIDGIDDRITQYVRACCAIEESLMIDVGNKVGLNLGCGELDQGAHLLNVDIRKTSLTEVIVDLEQFPWPFASEWATEIAAVDIIEHVIKAIKFVEECHRILKPGGRMRVRTTHWETEQSYRMLDHYHFCTPETFAIFDPAHWMCQKYPYYSVARFTVLKAERSGEELEFDLLRI